MTFTPAHLTNEERSVLRPVALAYRRAYRAGASQGECCDAALRAAPSPVGRRGRGLKGGKVPYQRRALANSEYGIRVKSR